ncbi:MAG: RHS repeat-associated core domain-containing protein, partial [Chloroflexales bacterium]|nr:RHS repeat-associated core domain-containing protein [Chloroflexales bacterium]
TGELQDDGDSGLVYLRARWYDPGSGRFATRDPFAGMPHLPYSLHPYQYAYSNPALYTDPTGECIAFLAYSEALPNLYHADLFMDDCSTCQDPGVEIKNKWKEHHKPCRMVFTDDSGVPKPALMYAGAGPQHPGFSGGEGNAQGQRSPGGLYDDDHPWGRLLLHVGDMGPGDSPDEEGFNDITEEAGRVIRLLLVNNDQPCDPDWNELKAFQALTRSDPDWNTMTYNPLLRNRNGMLHKALQVAGFPRIPTGRQHPVNVLGWNEDVDDPRYFWPEQVRAIESGGVRTMYVPYPRSKRGVR